MISDDLRAMLMLERSRLLSKLEFSNGDFSVIYRDKIRDIDAVLDEDGKPKDPERSEPTDSEVVELVDLARMVCINQHRNPGYAGTADQAVDFAKRAAIMLASLSRERRAVERRVSRLEEALKEQIVDTESTPGCTECKLCRVVDSHEDFYHRENCPLAASGSPYKAEVPPRPHAWHLIMDRLRKGGASREEIEYMEGIRP